MIIVAGGDSFVWGTEMADCNITTPSNSTYGALLTSSVNATYVNVARPGNSNDAIARMTRAKCAELLAAGEKVCAMVSWTFATRFEFLFAYDIDSRISPWCSVQPPAHGNNIDDDRIRSFADMFYKHVGINDRYQIYRSLEQVILLQSYFKENNIPYLFTLSDNSIFVKEYNFDEYDPSIKILWDSVEWDKWFFFPPATEHWLTTTPRGFYQWAAENKYECGPGCHPLENAHADAAKLMKEKFNEMVKKSV